jgi:prephenate dehydrogenase
MDDFKISIVGLGLIGASLALKLKAEGYENVFGMDINDIVMEKACTQGLIKKGDGETLKSSDVVFICLYPKDTVEFIKENVNNIKSDALITDVSGVKGTVVEAVNELLVNDQLFISGHPMAGREEGGFDNGIAHLFQGANYLLITDNKIKDRRLTWLKGLVMELGAKPVEIGIKKHDEMIALTSQVPHVIASVMTRVNTYDDTKKFVGNSFDDMTRISLINEKLWSELFIHNKKELSSVLLKIKDEISRFIDIIEAEDQESCEALLKESRLKREDYLRQ